MFFYASSFAQKDDAKNFFHTGSDLFSFTSRYDKNDWITFSSTIAATSAGFILDKPIKDFSQANKTPFLSALFEIDKYYQLETMSLSFVALYGYGWASNKQQPRELGLRLMESTVYASLINLTTKILLGRSRPYLEKGNFDFSPLNINFDTTSLPSLHATAAFAYSTVMAAEYNNFFWKALWFTAAGLVGGARIYHNVHWFSDVLLGAAIGYFVGDFVNNHHTNKALSNSQPLPAIILKIAF